MFFYTLLGLLLDNKEFKLFHIDFPAIFNSIGAVFKIALVGMIGGFFKIGEAIYGVYESLAFATDIFDKSIFSRIATNMYSIFGVVILFISAYNFLMYIVDPEKNSGDMSIEKMLKNVAKVFIIIVLLPTIFSLANGFVGSIVEGGVIENLIFGRETKKLDCEDTYSNLGIIKNSDEWTRLTEKNKNNRFEQAMADIFASFFTYDNASPETIKLTPEDNFYFPRVCCPGGCDKTCTLQDTIDAVKCTGRYGYYFNYGANWTIDDNTHFKFEFFLALLSICYVIYVLVSFCFDLAVRSIKLAFYQIVAPLCVGCSILPGPKKEIYSKWKSLTIKTYVAVFIRIFAMSLGVLFISSISSLMDNLRLSTRCDGFCSMLVKLFLILGILTFIKQMPKIIDELLGEDSGLGQTVRDKFKASGIGSLASKAAGVGAALGAGALAKGRAIKNLYNKRHTDKMNTARAGLKQAKKDKDKAAIKEARAAKKKLTKESGAGMLRGLANVAASGLGATLASASSQTNGFGLNGLKKKMSGLKDNALGAADSAENSLIKRNADSATRNKLKNRRAELKALEAKEAMGEDVGNKIKALKSEIDGLEKTTLLAQVGGRFEMAWKTAFGNSSSQLKAKEDVYNIMDQNDARVKQDGQTYLNKFGSNVKIDAAGIDGNNILTEATSKVCGAKSVSGAVASNLLQGMDYRNAQAELASIEGMNDVEFKRHLETSGVLNTEIRYSFNGSTMNEDELRSQVFAALANGAGEIDDKTKNYMNSLPIDKFISEAKSYGMGSNPDGSVSVDFGSIESTTVTTMNGAEVSDLDIANLQRNITSAIPGLKSELEKQAINVISDFASMPSDKRTVMEDNIFIGGCDTNKEDFLKFEASVEVANAGYGQAYGKHTSTAEERKNVKEEASKAIIELRKEASASSNRQAINKASNPNSNSNK